MKIEAKAKTIDVPESFSFAGECDFQAAEGESENKLPRLFIKANTGTNPMEMDNWPLPVILDLKGTKLHRKKLPIIMDHDRSQRVGHTEDGAVVQAGQSGMVDQKKINGPIVALSGVVSSTTKTAQEFTAEAKNGFPWEVSVGGRTEKWELIDEGKTGEANGKTFKGPMIIVRAMTIREITVTPIGADKSTSVKIAAKSKKVNSFKKGKNVMDKFEKWLKAMSHDIDSLDDEQIESLKAEHQKVLDLEAKAKTTPPPIPKKENPKPEPTAKEILAKDQAEGLQRALDIQAVAAKPEFKDAKAIKLGGAEEGLSLKDATVKAVSDVNITAQQFELACYNAELNYSPAPAIHNVDGNLEAEALTCALVRKLNGSIPMKATNKRNGFEYGLEKMFPQKVLEASDARQYKFASLHQLMDHNIRASGRHFNGGRSDPEFVKTFLYADQDLKAAQGFSNMAASNILENVAHKNLELAYRAQETVWQNLFAIKSLNDFKAHAFYRLHMTGYHEVIPEQGEFKHGEFSDDKYSVTAEVRGLMIALSYQAMVNDDLNAFEQIPTSLGRMAAIGREGACIELITANANNFFHADNKNLLASSDLDLNIAGLNHAAKKFRNQSQDGSPILTGPDRLLIGAQDEAQGDSLFQDLTVVHTATGTTDATDVLLPRNPHKGKYSPNVSPYLNNDDLQINGVDLTNVDENHWYMFGNPADIAAFYFGALNGNQIPTIESAQTDFNTLGMQWRSWDAWGIAQGDPKGAVKSPGA